MKNIFDIIRTQDHKEMSEWKDQHSQNDLNILIIPICNLGTIDELKFILQY